MAGRARAGRELAGFEICAAIPSAVVDDPAVAYRGIRTELHRYFGLPFYRAMFAQAGYEADIAAYDARRRDAQRDAISDAFIEDLCAIGKPADVAAGVARYRAAGAANPMITNIAGTRPAPDLGRGRQRVGERCSVCRSYAVRGAERGLAELALRAGGVQVVHAVLAGVRDQQRRGAVDVLGQHLDGPIRRRGRERAP